MSMFRAAECVLVDDSIAVCIHLLSGTAPQSTYWSNMFFIRRRNHERTCFNLQEVIWGQLSVFLVEVVDTCKVEICDALFPCWKFNQIPVAQDLVCTSISWQWLYAPFYCYCTVRWYCIKHGLLENRPFSSMNFPAIIFYLVRDLISGGYPSS